MSEVLNTQNSIEPLNTQKALLGESKLAKKEQDLALDEQVLAENPPQTPQPTPQIPTNSTILTENSQIQGQNSQNSANSAENLTNSSEKKDLTSKKINKDRAEKIILNYDNLLAQAQGDKVRAFEAIEAQIGGAIDDSFEVMKFGMNDDKEAIFDYLKDNQVFFETTTDPKRKERIASVNKAIATLKDPNATPLQKQAANDDYLDFLVSNSPDKKTKNFIKNEVVLPHYQSEKTQMFNDGLPFGDTDEAREFDKRLKFVNDKIANSKYNGLLDTTQADEALDNISIWANIDPDFDPQKSKRDIHAENIKRKIRIERANGNEVKSLKDLDLSQKELEWLDKTRKLKKNQAYFSPYDSTSSDFLDSFFKKDERGNQEDEFQNILTQMAYEENSINAYKKVKLGLENELTNKEKAAMVARFSDDMSENDRISLIKMNFDEKFIKDKLKGTDPYKMTAEYKFDKVLENVKKGQEILEKTGGNYNNTTPEQREYLRSQAGLGSRFFNSIQNFFGFAEDVLEREELDVLRARDKNKEVDLAQFGEDYAKIEGFMRHNLFTNRLANWAQGKFDFEGAQKDEKETYEQFIRMMDTFALNNGADGYRLCDDGSINFDYQGEEWKIKGGQLQNFFEAVKTYKYSALAGIVGGIKGAKKGAAKISKNPSKNPLMNAARLLWYSGKDAAIASGLFSAADYGEHLLRTDSDFSFRDMMTYAVSESVASAVGDVAVFGLGLGARGVYRAVTSGGVKNAAKKVGETLIAKPVQAVSWIIDKSPVVGTVKRMFSAEQNMDAAVKMMARNTTPEQRAAINEAMHAVGGEMKQKPNVEFFQNIADKFRAKFGEDSIFTRTAQKWADTISNRSMIKARQDMLNFVRSDESGSALNILLEVASRSDVVQKNLSNIITLTFEGLKKQIEGLGIKKRAIQNILNEAKVGTTESFNKAMNLIASEILPKDLYKTKLNTTKLTNLLEQLRQSESILVESELTKSTRQKLIDRLTKDKEFSFDDLRALEKDLNDMIYNKDLDKGFRKYIANALNNELKTTLRDGVYELFNQYAKRNAATGGKQIAEKMQNLFNVSMRDYADYKALEKMVNKYKLANEEADLNQVVDALVRIMKGQGKDGLDRLTQLTKYLSPENREVFEMAILKKFFDEASFESKNGIKAFDSLTFFQRLKSVDGKPNAAGKYVEGEVGERLIDKFQSKAAKSMLEYAENFQTAFLKDYEIAYKLTNPQAREQSTSILGTDLTRRGFLMAARMGWEWMRRNIGHIPFLRGFNEATQTAAFKYHLSQALREANGLEDFKNIFANRVKKAKFNNETMRVYKEFMDGVDEGINAIDDVAKMSDDEISRTFKVDENGNPKPPNDDGNGGGGGSSGGGGNSGGGFDSPSGNGLDSTPPRTPNSPQDSGVSPNANSQIVDILNGDLARAEQDLANLKATRDNFTNNYQNHETYKDNLSFLDERIQAKQDEIARIKGDIDTFSQKATNQTQNSAKNATQTAQTQRPKSLLEQARESNAAKRAEQKAETDFWDDFDKQVENAQFTGLDEMFGKGSSKTAQNAASDTAQTATKQGEAYYKPEEQVPQNPRYSDDDLNTPPNVREVKGDTASQAAREMSENSAPKPTGDATYNFRLKKAQEALDDIRDSMSEARQSGDKSLLKALKEQEQNYLDLIEKIKKENPNAAGQNSASQAAKNAENSAENSAKQAELERAASEADSEDSRAWVERQKNRQQEGFKKREESVGKTADEMMADNLEIGEAIPTQATSRKAAKVQDNKRVGKPPVKVEYVVVKKDDLRTEFSGGTGLQTRTGKKTQTIDAALKNYDPDKMFEFDGGFEGHPIIVKDGQVLAGNHRTEIVKNLTGEQWERYKQAVREWFNGLEIGDDEMIVRLIKDDLSKDDLIELANLSNRDWATNAAENMASAHSLYKTSIKNLDESGARIQYIGDSVDECMGAVARELNQDPSMVGKGANNIDKEYINGALFMEEARVTKNGTTPQIALENIDKAKIEPSLRQKIKDMFVKNIGALYNISRTPFGERQVVKNGVKKVEDVFFDLRGYLVDLMVSVTNKAELGLNGRWATRLTALRDRLDEQIAKGTNIAEIDTNQFHNIIVDVMGEAMAKYLVRTDPAASFFEFAKQASKQMKDAAAPGAENVFAEVGFGRNLLEKPIDEFDFLKAAIQFSPENKVSQQAEVVLDEIAQRLDKIRDIKLDLEKKGVKFNKTHEILIGEKAGFKWDGTSQKMDLSNKQSSQELKEFYAKNSTSRTDDELFNRTLEAAESLGVNVKFSDKIGERSFYDPATNTITISRANNGAVQAEDLLHELIHATTEKGLRLYKEDPAIARQIFTDKQIQAFNEIEQLFEKSKQIFSEMNESEFKAHLKDMKERGLLPKDFDINSATKESFTELNYGFKSVYEFVAELGNPLFSDMLKKQGIWETIKHAIANFFLSAKNLFETTPTTTYNALRKRYFTILDEYKKLPTKTDLKADVKEPSLFDSELRLFQKKRTGDDSLFTGLQHSLFDDESVNLGKNSAKNAENLTQNSANSSEVIELPENLQTIEKRFLSMAENYANAQRMIDSDIARLGKHPSPDFEKAIQKSIRDKNKLFRQIDEFMKFEGGGSLEKNKEFMQKYGFSEKDYGNYSDFLLRVNKIAEENSTKKEIAQIKQTTDKERLQYELKRAEEKIKYYNESLALFNEDKEAAKVDIDFTNEQMIKEKNKIKLINERLDELNATPNSALDRTQAIQRTAHYVDNYAKTATFKGLDKDKQEAILNLKDIKPAQMPDELAKTADFENITTHFNKKLDSEQRKFYLKLFDETKAKPDLVLENAKTGQFEYIKAYEHTQTKDLYYLAFTQKDDIIKITGIPTTQIRKVVKDIAESKKVLKAEDLGGILELRQAEKIQAPNSSSEILPNSKAQSQGDFGENANIQRIDEKTFINKKTNTIIEKGEEGNLYCSLNKPNKDIDFQVGDMTSAGKIDEIYGEQARIKGDWYHLSILQPPLHNLKYYKDLVATPTEKLTRHQIQQLQFANNILRFGVAIEHPYDIAAPAKNYVNKVAGYNLKQMTTFFKIHDARDGWFQVYPADKHLQNNINYKLETIKNSQNKTTAENSVNSLGNSAKNPQNSAQNSAQNAELVKKIQQKFGKDENYARDLIEWHKDSSPLTKEADGTPKVFYHGSKNADLQEFKAKFDKSGWGFWTTTKKDYSAQFGTHGKLYEIFVNVKNPFDYNNAEHKKLLKDIVGEKEYQSAIDWLKSLKEGGVQSDFSTASIINSTDFTAYGKKAKLFKQRLQKLGFDGIIDDYRDIIVFDSKQIKSIDNKGSWTDSGGNITKEKPQDTNAKHSYFNEHSENILMSNDLIGGGLAGGVVNGFETDENGNVSFNPQKFLSGFVYGVAGTRAVKLALQTKAGQNHALKVTQGIMGDYKALREHNLPLFAKIMQKIEPQTLLKPTKEAQGLSREVFNTELSDAIQRAIDTKAVPTLSEFSNKVHFRNIAEFKGYFDEVRGNVGIIKTPYKDIKTNIFYAFNHFTENTNNTNRNTIKPVFFETFKNPLFVVEYTPQGKNKPSTYFYKPFYNSTQNILNLIGIGVGSGGKLNFSTFYLDKQGNRLAEFLRRDDAKICYVAI